MGRVKWDMEGRSSIARNIEEKLHLVRRPLKENIAHAIVKLRSQKEKLGQTGVRLHQRDREIFERCIGAQLSKDHSRAAMYANECAEVRKMAKLVMSGELALERVIIRLETVEEFGDVMAQMAPIIGIVKETRTRLAGVIPEVAMELDSVNSLLSNTLVETGASTVTSADIEASDAEALKVLEEATAVAEMKMKEQFPEIPPMPLAEGRAEALPIVGLGGGIDVESEVYSYIKKHEGKIITSQCAEELKIPKEDVRKALERLKAEGKITLA
ncbi:MAG: Snf7 family protein [Candidatus Bathyarchaeia archaeon]